MRFVLFLALAACPAKQKEHDAGPGADGGDGDADTDGDGDGGGGTCVPQNRQCDGDDVVVCNAAGDGWDSVQTCDRPDVCISGNCVDLCANAADAHSYQGCEYFAVDLENADEQAGGYNPADAPFAVVVSNTQDAISADVRVFAGAGAALDEATVGPNDLHVFELGVHSVEGTGVDPLAFRIESSIPVSAYQFNPINEAAAFSNGASLLLPTSVLGRKYYAVTGDGITGIRDITRPEDTAPWGATVTVVGTEDATTVTITPSAPVAAGGAISGGLSPFDVTLDRFGVLNITSAIAGGDPGPEGDGNLSGTLVESSRPVAVFSGNVATSVPHGASFGYVCCGDHTEEQLWPVETWGAKFAVSRSPVRLASAPESDRYVLVASQDGTTLTFDPSQDSPAALDAGQFVSFSTTDDFTLVASHPVLLAQLTASATQASFECDVEDPGSLDACRAQTGYDDSRCSPVSWNSDQGWCTQLGDPAMSLVPPIDQFRSEYVFLVSLDYDVDSVSVVSRADDDVHIDGDPLGGLPLPVGSVDGVDWVARRVGISDGAHRLTSDQPTGVIVYGYDRDVAYAYPAGLDLAPINIE